MFSSALGDFFSSKSIESSRTEAGEVDPRRKIASVTSGLVLIDGETDFVSKHTCHFMQKLACVMRDQSNAIKLGDNVDNTVIIVA